MFITIYKYCTEKTAVCRALIDAAEMHRQVQFLFNSPRQDHKILYRIDQGHLIVQSDIKPICDGLFTQVAQYDMNEKTDIWKDGRQFRFRIRTVPRASEHGKKHYIKTMENRIKWLETQFEKRGMRILAVREIGSSNLKLSSKTNAHTGGTVKVSTWDYEGVLDITDKENFLKGYEQGIGAQKAYGCGMICFCG